MCGSNTVATLSDVGVNVPVTDTKGLLSVVLTLLSLYLMLVSMFL